MSDNPNAGYYQPSKGSLTGFDTAIVSGDNPNIAKTGWSIAELTSFLTNEFDGNFPTSDFVRRVNDLVNSHLNDFSNPHRVDIKQITKDIVGDLLTTVTPGTPPGIAPFLAFDASNALPIGDLFPAAYSTTNLYRMTEGAALVNPASEGVTIGTDYASNVAGIPLFSAYASLIPTDWATRAGTRLNTQLTQTTQSAFNFPFPFYMVKETNASGSFGVYIPCTQVAGAVYTATIFLLPTITGGSVAITQPSKSGENMIVSLDDGSFACSSTNVLGETFVYPSGLIKVSFSFTAISPTPNTAVQIIHLNPGNVDAVRNGQDGRPVFVMACPLVTQYPLNQPIPVVPGSVSSTSSQLTFDMTKIQVPTTIARMLLTIALDMYPMLPGAPASDPYVFGMGPLVITRDNANLFINVGGSTYYAIPILRGHNVISLSYAPDKLIVKTLMADRLTFTGTFPALPTVNTFVGSCFGYLKSLALYATDDKAQCVEYLTNG